MGIAVLDRAKAAHRPARWVVRIYDPTVDGGVRTFVRPWRKAACVGDHRGRAGCVCTTIEQHPRLDVHELAVTRRPVFVRELAGVAVDVADERLRPRVDDLHWPAGAKREHA